MGALLAHALATATSAGGARWRRIALVGVIGLAVGVAEGRMVWYNHYVRSMHDTLQGLLLENREAIKGRQVFADRWDRARIFVLEAMVGGRRRLAPDLSDFLRDSEPGEFLYSRRPLQHAAVAMVGSNRYGHLYQRVQ
jgi:hypothetical protein